MYTVFYSTIKRLYCYYITQDDRKARILLYSGVSSSRRREKIAKLAKARVRDCNFHTFEDFIYPPSPRVFLYSFVKELPCSCTIRPARIRACKYEAARAVGGRNESHLQSGPASFPSVAETHATNRDARARLIQLIRSCWEFTRLSYIYIQQNSVKT